MFAPGPTIFPRAAIDRSRKSRGREDRQGSGSVSTRTFASGRDARRSYFDDSGASLYFGRARLAQGRSVCGPASSPGGRGSAIYTSTLAPFRVRAGGNRARVGFKARMRSRSFQKAPPNRTEPPDDTCERKRQLGPREVIASKGVYSRLNANTEENEVSHR